MEGDYEDEGYNKKLSFWITSGLLLLLTACKEAENDSAIGAKKDAYGDVDVKNNLNTYFYPTECRWEAGFRLNDILITQGSTERADGYQWCLGVENE